MKMGKLIIATVAGMNLFCTTVCAEGGGHDDLGLHCSTSELKYAASINMEDKLVRFGNTIDSIAESGMLADSEAGRVTVGVTCLDECLEAGSLPMECIRKCKIW
jgi:hypothetical protein